MRKLILQEFITLDGMAAESDGGTNFINTAMQGDTSFVAGQEKLISSANTMLLGRKTYEMFAAYWPAVKEEGEKEFAGKINGMEKFVVSNTLDSAPWGDLEPAAVIRGRAEDEIAKLKQQPGSDIIIWGSISLAQSLINARLIDQLRLITCPAILSQGRPFFTQKITPQTLTLHSTHPQTSGAIELVYTRN